MTPKIPSKFPGQFPGKFPSKFSGKITRLSALLVLSTALIAPAPSVAKEPARKELPAEMTPWRDPDNPNVMVLDDDWDVYYWRRDTSGDAERAPGPVNMQRYAVVSQKHAFPTYFGLPVAFNPADLKAGEVDIAIVGLPSDVNPAGGAGWAANHMRLVRTYDHANTGHSMHLNLNYFEILNVVDYGNANAHPTLMAPNFADQALVLGEILDAGASYIAIGGDHGTQVASILALVHHYGPKSFAMVHFDAHNDLDASSIGLFGHGGRARRFAFENDWVNGEDLYSIGIRSPYHSPELIAWQQEVGDNYHFMAEFERDGFDAVWKKIKRETKGKKLYISFDMDVLDPAFAPGASNPEPGGISASEAMQMLRGLAIQNEVIGIDFVEYSPLMDDRHYNTGITMNRLMRAYLAGKAARKTGVTDPDYLAPGTIR